MKRKEILDRFEKIVKEKLHDEKIEFDERTWISQTWSNLGLDSLDVIEIIMYVEHSFGLGISDELESTFITPKHIFEYLKEYRLDKEESKYVPKVFFTSDLHLSHRNLVRKVSEWEDCSPCRDFETVEEMNDTIIKNINDTVGENDILYINGDFAITNSKNWKTLRQRIKCKNVHLILGNHDPISELLENKLIITDKENAIGFHIADLFSSVQHVKDIKVQIPGTNEHQRIFLSHYSHRTWESAHHGKWMLYGHSHGSLEEYQKIEFQALGTINGGEIILKHDADGKVVKRLYKTMDVGIDTHPNFRPYSVEELIEIMKDRINLGVDHHRAE